MRERRAGTFGGTQRHAGDQGSVTVRVWSRLPVELS